MVDGDLGTTNLLLGILAAVSVLQALVMVAVGIMAYKAYSTVIQTVRDIERRQVEPLVAQARALLTSAGDIVADVKAVTTRVNDQTERVDTAIRATITRADDAAHRVREAVTRRVHNVLGAVRGIRGAIGYVVNGHGRHPGGWPGHA